jgi:membrane dipeptidase
MPLAIVRQGVRRILDMLRGIDQLVWGLVFVRAVGLGPLAGVLAIFISDLGTLSKLYSEAIENIDRKQVEGVRATGAGPFAVIRYGYLPQVLPVFISQSLYFWESNTRSATILGIVGAGGIGMILIERFRASLYDQVAFRRAERARDHLRHRLAFASASASGPSAKNRIRRARPLRPAGPVSFALAIGPRAAQTVRAWSSTGCNTRTGPKRSSARCGRAGWMPSMSPSPITRCSARRWPISRPGTAFRTLPRPDLPRRNRRGRPAAKAEGRTAIVFGAQTPAPIEDDIGLVEILHTLGLRFMQLSYNNQSLLATGCYEAEDPGLTRMGREVIAEMNRVGLVVDMSHSAERSTLEAMEVSRGPSRSPMPIPPSGTRRRNKSDTVLRALAETGGMLGFSLYPHHLKGGSDCTLAEFCEMVARTAEVMGVDRLAIGSDLCQDQPDSVVEWMRVGRWTKRIDYGEGSADAPGFPPQPEFFRDNRDFPICARDCPMHRVRRAETDAILGGNWLRFFDESFGSMP